MSTTNTGRPRPQVLSRHGSYGFQTGMITASLLKRGLDMETARDAARAVRDAVASRTEVSTAELKEEIFRQLQRLGASEPKQPAATTSILPMVKSPRGTFPFSKGVVHRDLDTSGLPMEDASRLVDKLERHFKACRQTELPESQIRAKVTGLLEEEHGEEYARRYRLTHLLAQTEKPIVVLIGGATGVGKSTLAMELAYRLGVVWVTSTDMIRETLRTALSPDLVPGLHDHSFRGIVLGGQVLSNPRERVLAGFRQQAAQVGVGVKAVIQRAIFENAHLIIEGTHLTPPFEQYLPPDADCQLVPFMVALPDEREHRARFPQRAKHAPGRRSQTYLDAFQSVRWIQDDLLRLAEDSEAVVLTSSDRQWTLRAAIDLLSRGVDPGTSSLTSGNSQHDTGIRPQVTTLLLIIDGLGDEPIESLHGRTPLAAATTPTLNRLAATGAQGQVWTALDDGQACNTDEGILTILGARALSTGLGRGALEALGQGCPIPTESVTFRGNLATLDPDGAILDRRAGRISSGVEELLTGLRDLPLSGGVRGTAFPGHEHRVVVVLSGPGLSDAVGDTDPGSPAEIQRFIAPTPLDESPEAARTASALSEFLEMARSILRVHPLNRERREQGLLEANALLTRGAARPTSRRGGTLAGAMVARCNTALGIARHLGMRTATSSRMTGNLETDIPAKLEIAAQLLREKPLVVVHVKGADVAAHDRQPIDKMKFIGAVDKALGDWLSANKEFSGKLRIVVTADHGTSSKTGNHLPEPVPFLLSTWHNDKDVEEGVFDEESASHGVLGVLGSDDIAELLFLKGPASTG